MPQLKYNLSYALCFSKGFYIPALVYYCSFYKITMQYQKSQNRAIISFRDNNRGHFSVNY